MLPPGFEFERMQEAHIPLMADWLSRAHLQAWWREEEITEENVSEKYLPRITGHDTAIPYIVYLDKTPFGYIQYYHVQEGHNHWWPDVPGPDVIGIDQFIADENNLGKGYGTAMISQFIDRVRSLIPVAEVRTDPHPGNARAIRCYEKAGFQKQELIHTPDGPAWMMKLSFQ